jgi:transcriptional regulator with XRE-family HTH domain
VAVLADYTKMWELKRKIKEEGYTYEKLGAEIGMGSNTLSDKLNGKSTFTIDEVQKIVEILDINPREIPKYFFSL